MLQAELTKNGADAPRNVALTGPYGSGKSSVLAETQLQLEAAGLKVINLSLPSLGIGDGRIPKSNLRRDSPGRRRTEQGSANSQAVRIPTTPARNKAR